VETGAFGLEEGLKRAVARKQQPARKQEAEKADGAEVRLEVVPPKPDRSEWAQVLETLSGLYVRGVQLDWAAYDAPYGRRRVVLPTYPFQRQRYWWRGVTPHTATSASRSDKPHLGRRLRSPALEALVYEATYARSRPVHLEDHRLFGTLVAAGSSHVALVLSALEDAHGSPACTLENLAFPQALVLAEDEERTVQAIITSHGQGSSFEVKSLSDADGAEKWVLHATGGLRIGQVAQPKRVPSHEELRARCRVDGHAGGLPAPPGPHRLVLPGARELGAGVGGEEAGRAVHPLQHVPLHRPSATARQGVVSRQHRGRRAGHGWGGHRR
jgi:acyl transferase domain-containing protein